MCVAMGMILKISIGVDTAQPARARHMTIPKLKPKA